jgi:hypothetical protein
LPQKQDGRFMIVSESLSTKQFKAQYKGVDIPASIPNQGVGETQVRWFDSDTIRIGEYFKKRKKKKNITQLSSGAVVDTDSITDEDIALYQEQGITPVKDRDVEVDVIDWYKLTAFAILEHQEWPSKYFPGIPFYGEEDKRKEELKFSRFDCFDIEQLWYAYRNRKEFGYNRWTDKITSGVKLGNEYYSPYFILKVIKKRLNLNNINRKKYHTGSINGRSNDNKIFRTELIKKLKKLKK